MAGILHRPGSPDLAATPLTIQAELERAEMLGFEDISRDEFIDAIKAEVAGYFRQLDSRTCLDLVEVEGTRDADGSVTIREVGSYPCNMSSAFLDHLRAFMRQPNQPQVPVGRFLDSAHTVIVERTVQRHFDALCREGRPNMAAQFLDLELQLPSKRARLCSHARERLRSGVVPLTKEQLEDVSSLEDSEIWYVILQLAPESGERDYWRSMALFKDCLSQPMTESLTTSSPPPLIGDFMLHQTCTGSRVFLGNLVRSVIIHHLMFHLDEFLAATTEVVLRLPTFSATLGEEIARDLAAGLRESFKEKIEEFLKDAVLSKGDAIMDCLVEQLLSSDTSAKIVKRISGLSPQARKALATKHIISDTESFTEEEFALLSSEKYFWVKELRELRVSDMDVTKLLLQEHYSTPWAFYGDMDAEDHPSWYREILLDNHLTSCAHNLLDVKNQASSPTESIATTNLPASFGDVAIIARLHRFCGLAGVIPYLRRRKENCDGLVAFRGEKDDVARVSFASFYSARTTIEIDIIDLIVEALQGLFVALAEAQHLGLCCDSYTVLCIQLVNDLATTEAFRIQVSVVSQLYQQAVRCLIDPDAWNRFMWFSKDSPLRTALQPLLGSQLGRLDDSETHVDKTEWLHLCSLAAQFLSLAFLSYTQAHKGDLLPSFLAKPLRQVVLCGAGMPDASVIRMTTRSLTCIGDMLGEPAICFQVLNTSSDVDEASSTRYDLYANVADVVDTWGPAELLCASSDQGPFAMRIGGGILYTEDANGTRYHWSKTADLKNVSRSAIDPKRKLLIGAVRINHDCQSSYEDLREHASLQTLGTQGKSSKFIFDNLSFSIGGAFRVAAQASIKHNAGISHKEVEKGTAQDDVMSLVDYRSAVQVSYCTGICRRVRFRDMVADLLPAFGPSSVRSEADALAWQRLLDARIVELLRGDGDVSLEALDLSFFRDKVKEMYDSLFHSGMKSDMKLRVAWPSAGDRLAYSAILCSGGANAWAEILCESTRISTYAYIAPHCLQAVGGNPSACHSGWVPAAGLTRLGAFATKVQCVGSPATVANLVPGSMCFFVLMHKMVFAQVHRSDGEPVTLRVVLQTMPASARRRLVTLCYQNGREMVQLQESRAGSAARAEDVLIECAPGG